MSPEITIALNIADDAIVLIDECDYELVAAHNWRLWTLPGKPTYAVASIGRRQVRMHRLIAGVTSRFVLVDHWSGDGLDNRRFNLRTVTSSQNAMNRHRKKLGCSSQFIGVSFKPGAGNTRPWQAKVVVGNRDVFVKFFDTEIEAAHARDEAARIHHGEYAALNFPQPHEVGCLV